MEHDIMDQIIKAGIDVTFPSGGAFTFLQQTVLHQCIKHEKLQTLECLLKNGADPNIENINGQKPLHTAIDIVNKKWEEISQHGEEFWLRMNYRSKVYPLVYCIWGRVKVGSPVTVFYWLLDISLEIEKCNSN